MEGSSLLGCYASSNGEQLSTLRFLNCGNYLPVDTASHIRRRMFSVNSNCPANCKNWGRNASEIKLKTVYSNIFFAVINIYRLDIILLLQTDAHNCKIIGILKQLKFRLSLRHVSVNAGTIIRELFRA